MSSPVEADRFDVIVLGAGPAGVNAALAAAGAGARVLLLDEAPEAGGQIWRAPAAGLERGGPGETMRAALAASPVTCAFGHRVWMVTPGFRVDAIGPEGARYWHAPALVACLGTHERVMPFPGWTLPGVTGLAAATILLKAQGIVRGQCVLVAGAGPLLAVVAAGILHHGARVAGIADLSGAFDWLAAMPSLLARPDLMAEGAGWIARIAQHRVPWHRRHAISEVMQGDGVLRATLAPVDSQGRRVVGPSCQVEADAVAVGHGLVPDTALTRLLRAEHVFAPLLGGWVPRVNDAGQTTVPGLFVAGDGAGVRGAAAAVVHGQMAGLEAAAHALGKVADPVTLSALRHRWRRASRFSAGFAPMVAPRDAAVAQIAAETVICRCESLRRSDIDVAVAAGARDLNQLKQWTRCGMGPCQGRFCGEAAVALLGAHGIGREGAGQWSGRAPLRPVDVADLCGRFDYGDIPIPKPAPL